MAAVMQCNVSLCPTVMADEQEQSFLDFDHSAWFVTVSSGSRTAPVLILPTFVTAVLLQCTELTYYTESNDSNGILSVLQVLGALLGD